MSEIEPEIEQIEVKPPPPKLNLVPKQSNSKNYLERMKNKEKFEGYS